MLTLAHRRAHMVKSINIKELGVFVRFVRLFSYSFRNEEIDREMCIKCVNNAQV